MTIAVLCKWCPDPADLEVAADGSISLERARYEIGEYDRVALEVGMSLAGGRRVVAVSAGATEINTSLARKAILSQGPEALFLVVDDRLADADAGQSASALAAAITRIGDVNLVVAGTGSADQYAQQVGIQVGERLGWQTLNEVMSVTLDTSSCRVERHLGDAVETLDVTLPAALTMTTDAASPRTPGMRDILNAGKRSTTMWSLDDLGLGERAERASSVLATVAPHGTARQQIRLDGSTDKAVEQLVGVLRREGLA